MIDLKESCRNCKDIDRCINVVANNINNMALPNKKKCHTLYQLRPFRVCSYEICDGRLQPGIIICTKHRNGLHAQIFREGHATCR